MIIGLEELVNMFGSEENKTYYYKNKKLQKKTKDLLLNKASFNYDIANIKKGKYELIQKYDYILEHTNENRRRVDYEFINYDISFDKLNGVYSVIYENYIYIGSTISGFRNRHSSYSLNLKNSKIMCGGDKLIALGGTIDILWSTESSNEFEIRNKELEYIDYFIKNTDMKVINKTINVNVLDEDVSNRKITVKADDYERVVGFLKENNIKFV